MTPDSKIEFLHDRPVPKTATCDEHLATGERCGKSAMMLVRVDAQEYFVCYNHLSLLYNRSRQHDE